MKTALLLFDDFSPPRLINGKPPLTSMSHDFNLFQFAHEARRNGIKPYYATVSTYYGIGSRLCHSIEAVYPTLQTGQDACTMRDLDPDMVLCCHPQRFNYDYAPRAIKVGIHPAIYMVEMPDLYDSQKTFDLLKAVRHNIDYFIVQNERMKEILVAMYGWLAKWDDPDRILVSPLGLVPEEETLVDRTAARTAMGCGPEEIMILNGGGVWRWTGFNEFLAGFVKAVRGGAKNLTLAMSGLRQTENTDHGDYIAETNKILAANADIVGDRFDAKSPADRSRIRIHAEMDWDRASRNLPTMLAAADLGLNVNRDGLENWQAHRVRCLSYARYGLPLLSTPGDALSEGVLRPCTIRLPSLDESEIAQALLSLSRAPRQVADARTRAASVRPLLSSTRGMGRAVLALAEGARRPNRDARMSLFEVTQDRREHAAKLGMVDFVLERLKP